MPRFTPLVRVWVFSVVLMWSQLSFVWAVVKQDQAQSPQLADAQSVESNENNKTRPGNQIKIQ